MSLKKYSVWSNDEGDVYSVTTGEERPKYANGEYEKDAKELLFIIEACNWEEAMAIYNLRLGYNPYKPQGESAPCPRCGANYYPEGSGQCWKCDFQT